MGMALKMAAAYLDSKGLKYRLDEENDRIRVGFNTENKGSIDLVIVFDKDDTSIGIRSFDFCKFAESKRAAMYEVCSKMNKQYRWAKFYVDESDNTVTVADDAVIQAESCGEEVFELIYRLVSIGDEAYPSFMKALWA